MLTSPATNTNTKATRTTTTRTSTIRNICVRKHSEHGDEDDYEDASRCKITAVNAHGDGSQYEYERINDDIDKDQHDETFAYENEAHTLNFWRSPKIAFGIH